MLRKTAGLLLVLAAVLGLAATVFFAVSALLAPGFALAGILGGALGCFVFMLLGMLGRRLYAR